MTLGRAPSASAMRRRCAASRSSAAEVGRRAPGSTGGMRGTTISRRGTMASLPPWPPAPSCPYSSEPAAKSPLPVAKTTWAAPAAAWTAPLPPLGKTAASVPSARRAAAPGSTAMRGALELTSGAKRTRCPRCTWTLAGGCGLCGGLPAGLFTEFSAASAPWVGPAVTATDGVAVKRNVRPLMATLGSLIGLTARTDTGFGRGGSGNVGPDGPGAAPPFLGAGGFGGIGLQ
mmetsp:Transcript_9805/g.30260  ORF Transcript_9805/g.30260 Transcript_9805/m.30260 type:complete len:231 (+) Transcript_9805:642-1334(+)